MGLRTKQRGLNSESGFSLVELMVVVAIIGILSTVAVPSVTKWLSKAKQTEAKSNLASLYSGMKAFFAEYQAYHGNFHAIGYEPEGNLRYRIGFASGTTDAAIVEQLPDIAKKVFAPHINSSFCNIPITATSSLGESCKELPSAAAASGQLAKATWNNAAGNWTFTAVASADLDGDGADFDTWSINQAKTLTHSSLED